MEFIKHVIKCRYGIYLLHCYVVDGSAVDTHSKETIFFPIWVWLELNNDSFSPSYISLAISSSTCRYNSLVSSWLHWYAALLGREAPECKSIWCSLPIMRGNPSGKCTRKTSLKSSIRLYIFWCRALFISLFWLSTINKANTIFCLCMISSICVSFIKRFSLLVFPSLCLFWRLGMDLKL